jgi:hypothetical protein
VKALAQHCGDSLIEVNLDGCSLVSDAGAEALAGACPNVEVLWLDDTAVSAKCRRALVRKYPDLEGVDGSDDEEDGDDDDEEEKEEGGDASSSRGGKAGDEDGTTDEEAEEKSMQAS